MDSLRLFVLGKTLMPAQWTLRPRQLSREQAQSSVGNLQVFAAAEEQAAMANAISQNIRGLNDSIGERVKGVEPSSIASRDPA